MSILNFFSGLGKFTFSIRKIAKININITNKILNRIFPIELPKLGCLLYLSCILSDLI